jgi:hypothetical protein
VRSPAGAGAYTAAVANRGDFFCLRTRAVVWFLGDVRKRSPFALPLKELNVRKLAPAALVAALLAAPAAWTAEPAPDPDLAKFRQAYTSGSGIAYVVIHDDKGDRIYRYGDASRETAKKDARGYVLFTCLSPHVFVVQNPPDKTALLNATVVQANEPSYADFDGKYLAGCKNPLVKTAVKKGK